MSEAELASLFQNHTDSVANLLFGYFSVTSAFLVASYLAAQSLSRSLRIVVLALYSVTALTIVGYCNRHATVAVAIREELRALGATWHTAVSEPSFILPSLNNTIVVSMLAIYAASIWYHFHAAKRNNNDA